MTVEQKRARRMPAGRALWAASVLVSLGVLAPSRVEAIPAFARQFNVKCTTCHAPIPPRLNTVGLTFKRMGFRMPDVDEDGNLTLKAKPSRSAAEDVSLLGDFRGENHRDQPTTFAVDSLMARGGGAVGTLFSYVAEVTWSGGAFSLDDLEAQVLLGRPAANFTARFGILVPLIWERSDHTVGVTAPLLLSTPVAVGDFGGSAIGDTRTGVELGVNFNHFGEAGSAHNTYVAVTLFNRLGPGDPGMPAAPAPAGGMGAAPPVAATGGPKDVLFQAVHLFGDSNSIGALWYHGNVFNVGPSGLNDQLDRVALMGNYVLPTRTDLVAAVGVGKDRPTAMNPMSVVDSRGWYVELDQPIVVNTVAFVRFDRFEPDTLNLDMRAQGPTIGVTCQFLDNLLVTAEYQGLRTGTDVRGRDFVVRAVLAY